MNARFLNQKNKQLLNCNTTDWTVVNCNTTANIIDKRINAFLSELRSHLPLIYHDLQRFTTYFPIFTTFNYSIAPETYFLWWMDQFARVERKPVSRHGLKQDHVLGPEPAPGLILDIKWTFRIWWNWTESINRSKKWLNRDNRY